MNPESDNEVAWRLVNETVRRRIEAAIEAALERGWRLTAKRFGDSADRSCCPIGAVMWFEGHATASELDRLTLADAAWALGLPGAWVQGFVDGWDGYEPDYAPGSQAEQGHAVGAAMRERYLGRQP